MRNFRTYLAGLGSSGALIAAAIAGFIAVGAIVGFDALPGSSAADDSSTVMVQSNAPEIAAASAVGPGAAPAADPAPGAGAAVAAATAPAAGAPGTGGAPSGTDDIPVPDVPGGDGTTDPPGLPDPPVPPPDGGTNDVGGLVDEVDETVEDVTGINPDLGGATGGITDAVDGAVGNLTDGRGLGLDQIEIPDLQP